MISIFILHVGLPIIISFPNASESGFRIGDRVDLRVAFMGNPEAKVSWVFIAWNNYTSTDVPVHRIQNQSKYHTSLVIETLNSDDFGTYNLRLNNIHGSISKDFTIQGIFLSFNFFFYKSYVPLYIILISCFKK